MLDEADCEEEKQYWTNKLTAPGNQDGYCENKAVIRRTIAALCAYDEQALEIHA
jgi:hypothetical protein